MSVKIYQGLQSGDLCAGVLSLCSCDGINAVFCVILVEVGDKELMSRVRLVEAANTGDT